MRPFPYVHPALALSPCVPVPPASDGNGFTMLLEPRDQFSPKLMLFCARRRPPPPPPPPGPPMTKGRNRVRRPAQNCESAAASPYPNCSRLTSRNGNSGRKPSSQRLAKGCIAAVPLRPNLSTKDQSRSKHH